MPIHARTHVCMYMSIQTVEVIKTYIDESKKPRLVQSLAEQKTLFPDVANM